MAKMNPKSGYEWMKATMSEDKCRITYRVIGATVNGSDGIDEDGVAEWSDDDIRKVVGQMLDVPTEYHNEIEVIWN
jgi:hypothetical protein